jgi:hypothetical protein
VVRHRQGAVVSLALLLRAGGRRGNEHLAVVVVRLTNAVMALCWSAIRKTCH